MDDKEKYDDLSRNHLKSTNSYTSLKFQSIRVFGTTSCSSIFVLPTHNITQFQF